VPLYQITGRDIIFDWLGGQTDSERTMAMLDWLVEFAGDPHRYGQRVPGVRAPAYIAIVPLREPVVVRYLLAEQFHTINVLAIGPLP
jgi:hypothetical protein